MFSCNPKQPLAPPPPDPPNPDPPNEQEKKPADIGTASSNVPLLWLMKPCPRRQQFFKTKLCPWWMAGKCVRGKYCNFAHDNSDVRDLPNLQKTKMCEQFLKGGYCLDTKCRYAHDLGELRHTAIYYKTKLCVDWECQRCTRGISCRMAHGAAELRARPDQPQVTYGAMGFSSNSGGAGLLSELRPTEIRRDRRCREHHNLTRNTEATTALSPSSAIQTVAFPSSWTQPRATLQRRKRVHKNLRSVNEENQVRGEKNSTQVSCRQDVWRTSRAEGSKGGLLEKALVDSKGSADRRLCSEADETEEKGGLLLPQNESFSGNLEDTVLQMSTTNSSRDSNDGQHGSDSSNSRLTASEEDLPPFFLRYTSTGTSATGAETLTPGSDLSFLVGEEEETPSALTATWDYDCSARQSRLAPPSPVSSDLGVVRGDESEGKEEGLVGRCTPRTAYQKLLFPYLEENEAGREWKEPVSPVESLTTTEAGAQDSLDVVSGADAVVLAESTNCESSSSVHEQQWQWTVHGLPATGPSQALRKACSNVLTASKKKDAIHEPLHVLSHELSGETVPHTQPSNGNSPLTSHLSTLLPAPSETKADLSRTIECLSGALREEAGESLCASCDPLSPCAAPFCLTCYRIGCGGAGIALVHNLCCGDEVEKGDCRESKGGRDVGTAQVGGMSAAWYRCLTLHRNDVLAAPLSIRPECYEV